MKIGFLSGLLSFAVITVLSICIRFALSFAGIGYNKNIISAWSVFLVFLVLIIVFRKQIRTYFVTLGLNWLMDGIDDQLGIKKIYKNLCDAQDDMIADFRSARNVRLFFQLGRGVIGGQHSLLFDEAKEKKESDFQLQILFVDRKSRFLTKSRAKLRGSIHKEWESVPKYMEDSIEVLNHAGINVEARRHSEPFLWRLFFFDETLYFMPYLYNRHNHKYAPVLKMASNVKEERVLYYTLLRYYTDVWNKNIGDGDPDKLEHNKRLQTTARDNKQNDFCGMWKGRTDMDDAKEYVRNLRKRRLF